MSLDPSACPAKVPFKLPFGPFSIPRMTEPFEGLIPPAFTTSSFAPLMFVTPFTVRGPLPTLVVLPATCRVPSKSRFPVIVWSVGA